MALNNSDTARYTYRNISQVFSKWLCRHKLYPHAGSFFERKKSRERMHK